MITALAARLEVLRSAERDAGVTAVEYGLLLALILGVIAGTVATLGTNLQDAFNDVVGAFGGGD